MAVIDHSASAAAFFLDFMVHKVSGKLTCGSAAVNKSPYDPVFVSAFAYLNNAGAILGVRVGVAHIFAGSAHKEIIAHKRVKRSPDVAIIIAFACNRSYSSAFILGKSVAQISTVSFVPTMAVTLFAEVDKALNKIHTRDLHIVLLLVKKVSAIIIS